MNTPVGLVNLGNTCYINAVLQCLVRLQPLVDVMIKNSDVLLESNATDLSRKFLQITRDIGHCRSQLPLYDFVKCAKLSNPFFGGREQHDAQEFLIYLMSTIRNDFTVKCNIQEYNLEAFDPFMSKLFQFTYISSSKCCACGIVSDAVDTVYDLSVPLPKGRGDSTLDECMNLLRGPTKIDFNCVNNCSGGALNTVHLIDLPHVLIIHLKRFNPHKYRNEFRFRKDKKNVQYGMEWIITNNTGENLKYSLESVIEHHGSAGSGHYIAKCQVNGRYFKFDDDTVSDIQEREMVSQQAYILFYSFTGSIFQPPSTSSPLATHPSCKLAEMETPSPHITSAFASPQEITRMTSDQATAAQNETLTLLAPAYFPSHASHSVFFEQATNSQIEPPSLLVPPSPSPQVLNDPPASSYEKSPTPVTSPDHITFECNSSQHFNVVVANNTSSLQDKLPAGSTLLEENNNYVNPVICTINDPILTEDDIPGAKLNLFDLKACKISELQFWLECRGLPVKGVKADLINRIEQHVRRLKAHIIDPRVGGGVHYEKKRMKLSNLISQNRPPVLPVFGWKPFPSVGIPNNFNYGHVFHYLIETLPKVFPDSTSDDDDCQDLDEDESLERKPFSNFSRGQQFVDSGYVRNLQDIKRMDFYFLKAEVQASMDMKVYIVTVTLSDNSGSVIEATCNTCKQSSLGRCSHVTAVLLYILKHIDKDGYEAISCTGRECTWGKGAKKRNPGPVRERNYNPSVDYKRRVSFDPRPRHLRDNEEDEVGAINSLIGKLSKQLTPSLWSLTLTYHYQDYSETDMDISIISDQCSMFFRFLNEVRLEHEGPVEITRTAGQGSSQFWRSERCVRATASEAKRILGLSTSHSRMKFLQTHLWGMNTTIVPAMVYGQVCEEKARVQYEAIMKERDPSFAVKTVGIFINSCMPGLSCSPDGLAMSDSEGTKLIEIKCPYSLKGVDPHEFEIHLTPDQQKRFILKRDSTGSLQVQKSHKWNYQMQMSLDILSLHWCDLIIWSEEGILIVPVEFDPEFWHPKRTDLIDIHRKLFVPELFTMRTARSLPPLLLDYPEYHEHELDTYFYDITLEEKDRKIVEEFDRRVL